MKITMTFDPKYLERFIKDYLEKNEDDRLICLYQKREKAEWDSEDVYNVWLYSQITWVIFTQSWLDEFEEFIKWYDNIQSADVSLLPNQK